MISVISTTDKYILQPSLMGMHRESSEWISAAQLWKRELAFFQKLIDKHSQASNLTEFKKQIDHFQHLITYYDGEIVDGLLKQLMSHERNLAQMLQQRNESDVIYFREHKDIIESVTSFNKTFTEFKHNLFEFVERGFSAY